uniref:Oligopeptide transporter 4 n=1 Tax=Kalanchoe fedtschenkoi TaxID=63787 RepID=A0A7N0UXN5_KALFE
MAAAAADTSLELSAAAADDFSDDENSTVEQVRLTVSTKDDPTLPVYTFRMWSLGLVSCVLLSFINTFFSYRAEPLTITMISVQIATLPIGRFMARALPTRMFRVGSWEFSLNPGPFNMKEHVLISIFANAGSAFGGGGAYAISIIDIIKAFYMRKISFLASFLLVITTQVLGYGWAGIMRKYVVDPAEMWWPSSLVQVSLFSALHKKDNQRMSRAKFFVIALICSFAWSFVPQYLMPALTYFSWICWAFPNSVTAHQLGSGLRGLGYAAFTLDWSVVASYLGSPLTTPFFAILNVIIGYVLYINVVMPVAYWGLNLYGAHKFPILSSGLFDGAGQQFDVKSVVNQHFELDIEAYEKKGPVYLSTFFAISYGLGFAAVVATLTHVILFNGKEIYKQYKGSTSRKMDVHTRLMKKYKDVPTWWFHTLMVLSLALSLVLCIFMKDQVQLPWWGLIFAAGMAFTFTLPISIITATTNQSPGLNIITEYVMGLILPGRPIANVCFKTYGYISMAQALAFLNDFKLGHYMKIPPISMFIVQTVGTILAGIINVIVAWWMLTSIPNICQRDVLPENSPWTCPGDHVFFNASVIWGLIGPTRIFGKLGYYKGLNWFFLIGSLGPLIIYLLHKAFPKQEWIPLINLPVLLGATGAMPPASPVNFNAWIIVGVVFNYFVFKYRKGWWTRYNYVLSAAMDAGLAFMSVLLYFSLQMWEKNLTWWGASENCPLAECPTAKGILVDGCPPTV